MIDSETTAAAQQTHVARSAGIIALGNVSSRLLGLVRDQITAGLFGRTGATDAFFVASNISQVFYDLIIQGAVSSALVPVFSSYAGEEERARLWRLASLVLNLVVAVLSLVVVVLAIAAPLVVRLAGPGFTPEQQQLATTLTRVTLTATIFLGSSAVLTALLYALQDFIFPAFCSALFNGCIIIVALLFHQQLGVGSLAIGMLVGALAQVLFQLPPLLRRKMAFALGIDVRDPDLRRILLLYAPVAAGLVVSGVQVFIDRNLASRTGEGSISAMQFATRIIQFPLGIIPTAISFASLPVLSRQASDLTSFRQTLGTSLRLIIFLVLPAAVGLAVLAQPLVATLFQHGAFSANDTRQTSLALLLYIPGLPAAAIDQMLIFAFYARKNTLTPVLVGVAAIGVYLAVALPSVGPLGMRGLVLANSAQWIAHATILFILLWRSLQGLGGLGIGQTVWRTVAATAAMALLMLMVIALIELRLPATGFVANTVILVAGALCGLAVFFALAATLRMEEVRLLLGSLKRVK
jgi:putative peptidoglycan lipid II flippase